MSDTLAEQLCNTVVSVLEGASFPPDFKSEEKELQPHVEKLLRPAFAASFPGVKMLTSVGGERGTAPCLRMYGTDFWQDIVFHSEDDGRKLVAVELKLVKDHGLSTAMSGVLGQCLINQLDYETVVGFILSYVKGNGAARYHEKDSQFPYHLKSRGIRLVIRTL